MNVLLFEASRNTGPGAIGKMLPPIAARRSIPQIDIEVEQEKTPALPVSIKVKGTIDTSLKRFMHDNVDAMKTVKEVDYNIAEQ